MATAAKEKRDVHQTITNAVIAALEAGCIPWRQPWKSPVRVMQNPLRHCGQPYRGINRVSLWAAMQMRGYMSPYWMTFKQAQSYGGNVRKGEKGTRVIYMGDGVRRDDDGEVSGSFKFLREYTVFSAEQCDGLPQRFFPEVEQIEHDSIAAAESAMAFVKNTGAAVVSGGCVAAYARDEDHILMPPVESFESTEDHAATLLHELIHWTGHESRLGRPLGGRFSNPDAYAREELIAELGSAFLCADLAVSDSVRDLSAAYIEHWLGQLRNDKTLIPLAAASAAAACDYLNELQPQAAEEVASH